MHHERSNTGRSHSLLLKCCEILNDKSAGKLDTNKAAQLCGEWSDMAETLLACVSSSDCQNAVKQFTSDLSALVLSGVKEEAAKLKETLHAQLFRAAGTDNPNDDVWYCGLCDQLIRLSSVMTQPEDDRTIKLYAYVANNFLKGCKATLIYDSQHAYIVLASRLGPEAKSVLSQLAVMKKTSAALKKHGAPAALANILFGDAAEEHPEGAVDFFEFLSQCESKYVP
jgi:hypothetical protein